MIQVTQDSQWRWLNRWKNRAVAGIDAIEMEMEAEGRKPVRTPAIHRIRLFPGGYLVERETEAANAVKRHPDDHASTPP